MGGGGGVGVYQNITIKVLSDVPSGE